MYVYCGDLCNMIYLYRMWVIMYHELMKTDCGIKYPELFAQIVGHYVSLFIYTDCGVS